LAYGARGFLWYTYDQVGNDPELALGMPFLAREVRSLKPFVIAPDVPNGVAINAARPEHLHVALRRAGTESLLVAVNTATETQTVQFVISAAIGKRLWVIAENRSVNVEAGRFADRFGPYGTHLYTTSEKYATGERLADVQQAIDRANSARKRPGNLAFEDSGVAVTTSSDSTNGSTPGRVVDGVLTNLQWRAAVPVQLPQWIALEWPTTQTIGRVVVYTSSIADYAVQVPTDRQEWRSVATIRAAATNPTAASFPAVQTKAIRILVTKLRPRAGTVQAWEIEAYEK
jgi:hypothetical protein